MKKTILFFAILASLSISAQEVASTTVTTKQQWFFAGQTIKVDGNNNKSITTTWVKKDSLTGAIIKTDNFTHVDTNFNSFWDSYSGFTSLVTELAHAEGLTVGDSSKLEDSFYNKHVATKPQPFNKPVKKK